MQQINYNDINKLQICQRHHHPTVTGAQDIGRQNINDIQKIQLKVDNHRKQRK
jgi:hypothetical protein